MSSTSRHGLRLVAGAESRRADPLAGRTVEAMDPADLRALDAKHMAQLATLSSISELLNESYQVPQVLERVLDVVLETMSAERGFLMLDRGGEVPELAAARGIQPDLLVGPHGLPYSHTTVRRVLREGEPLLSVDVQGDPELAASASLKALGTRCILCVPMKTRGRNIGLIYVDSCSSTTLFTSKDLKLLQIIAGMAASAIERAEYVTESLQNEKLAALGTMVATIAHELSDPLSAVSGVAGLIASDPTDAEVPALATSIQDEAARCLELVRSLLQVARKPMTGLPHKQVRLEEVVATAVTLLGASFRTHRIVLDVECPPDLPPVSGSRDALVQVVINLLTNARRAVYAREGGGHVAVRASARDGQVRLQISDDGGGIPPADLARVFDPFFSTRSGGEGTGLGLSIVHRLVTEHGGTIRVHNDPAGGAVFTVSLPAAD